MPRLAARHAAPEVAPLRAPEPLEGGPGNDPLKPVRPRAMIAFLLVAVTNFTRPSGGCLVEHAGREALMASQPLESSAARVSPWSATSSTCNRSYLVAAMRAGVIALVLLGILALIVLF